MAVIPIGDFNGCVTGIPPLFHALPRRGDEAALLPCRRNRRLPGQTSRVPPRTFPISPATCGAARLRGGSDDSQSQTFSPGHCSADQKVARVVDDRLFVLA